MEEIKDIKSPVKARKQKVMVIGMTGERFAFDLAKKGFDVMVVKNMADAFIERYGDIVYKRNLEGEFQPMTIATGAEGQVQLKQAGVNRQQRRKILRNLNKQR